MFCICVIIFLTAFFDIASSQNSCVDPLKNNGTCIVYYLCPEILKLIISQNRTQKETMFVIKSRCGEIENGRIKVCCQVITIKPEETILPEKTTIITKNVTTIKPKEVTKAQQRFNDILPKAPYCGQEGISERMLYGNITAIDQYPWMALIQYEGKNKRSFSCESSLISKRYILTAAHCVTGHILTQVGNPISVRLGEFDKLNPGMDCVETGVGDEEDCTDDPVDIDIENIMHHPRYNLSRARSKHDIALIRLISEAPYTDYIRPICLPENDVTMDPIINNQLMTAGWGAAEIGGGSDKKLHASLTIMPLDQCAKKIINYKLSKRQICAVNEAEKSCQGDLGGPLMQLKDDTNYIVGVVSFRQTSCKKFDVPTVFSKVYKYLKWININVKP